MNRPTNTPALRSTKATGRPITTDRPGAVVANMRWKAYPTITASESVSGVSVAIVVTSDSTAITSLESKLKSVASGVTIANGDSHSGAHVCGFNVSKNGHTYQVDVYGTVPTTICSAQAQASFLQDAA
jgi:hypothetical protein